MIKKLTFLFLVCLSFTFVQAQTLDELKAKKADLEASQAAKQAEADGFQGEIDALAKEIDILSGWQTGLSGLIGLNFGGSSNWRANANPNNSFSNLTLGVNTFANNIKEKSFWRNSLIANLGWQGLDPDTDRDGDGTGFLESRNADVLVGSSLYGYRLNQDIAISALGDLNTSVFNFLSPGSFDVGVGVTWTPHTIPGLTVVIHPLTFHWAWSALDNVESQSATGAKIKATYSHEFPGGIVWTSNLGAFLPYGDTDTMLPADAELGIPARSAGLFEYTWINSLNIANLWKGVGVGLTYGIRGAKFEHPDTQNYSALGLTYGF